MFKRDKRATSTSPPGRPPGLPKLSFIRNKQSSQGGCYAVDSLSMRFNAATSSLDNEEDNIEVEMEGETVTLVTHSSPFNNNSAGGCAGNSNNSRIHASNNQSTLIATAADGNSNYNTNTDTLNSSVSHKTTTAVNSKSQFNAKLDRVKHEEKSIAQCNINTKSGKKLEEFILVPDECDDAEKVKDKNISMSTSSSTTSKAIANQEILGEYFSSKSAPVSQVTTPDMEKVDSAMAASTSVQPITNIKTRDVVTPSKPYMAALSTQQDEEKSIFSGIKERLHDKFQNNLSVVIGKIEEISGESGISEALERRLRKGDSLDSNKSCITNNSERASITNSVLKREGTISSETSRSRHSSRNSDVFDDCDIACEECKIGEQKYKSLLEFSSDEMYQELEDFSTEARAAGAKQRPSSTSGVPTAELQQLDQQSKSSKFSMKNWNLKSSGKEKKNNIGFGGMIETSQSVPLSMSALLSQKEQADVLEEELLADQLINEVENEQQQPNNDSKKTSNNDTPSGRTTSNTNTEENGENHLKKQICESPIIKESEKIFTQEQISRNKNTNLATPQRTDSKPFYKCQNVVSAIIAFIAYLFIPLPSYLAGMICGAVIATCSLLVYQWLMRPHEPVPQVIIPDIRNKPALVVPEMKESRNTSGKFTGWMNELPFYDPNNYHISNTKSIFVQLEGVNLRLQTPKQGIPKRAMWNEPSIYHVSFIKQRFFDLTESKVNLLPEGLVSKRIWSKKYPICITLAKKGQKYKVDSKKEGGGLSSTMLTDEAVTLGYDMLNSGELCNVQCLYLFARTCREKEEWYHRFVAVTKATPLPTRLSDLVAKVNKLQGIKLSSKISTSLSSIEASLKHDQREGSCDSNVSDKDSTKESELYNGDYFERRLIEYIQCMAHLMPATEENNTKRKSLPNHSIPSTSADGSVIWGTLPVVCDPGMMWVNAALGRLFFDFLREQYWAEKVRDKIQRKLSKIHVPYFIDELTVTGIDLGTQIPVIQRASKPYLDDRGLWLDIEIAYSGGFTMSLETKVNLMKLRKKHSDEFSGGIPGLEDKVLETDCSRGWAVTDSAEEDSAESSTDEEEEEYQDEKLTIQTEPAGKKFLKIVDRIAQSKYFQQATENKYIKKAMEGVSNTRLMLAVEVKSCVGTMALNIPPPPTDRLWYGFRSNPSLVLSAKPRVGQHQVSIAHVTEWIEKKLAIEFQRLLVMPNLDDLEIPVLSHSMYGDIINPEEVAQEAKDLVTAKEEDEDLSVDVALEPVVD